MPISMQEIRTQYPQYDDLSDEKLMRGLHNAHYSDMSYTDFVRKVQGDANPTEGMSGTQKFIAGVGQGVVNAGRGLRQFGTDAAASLSLLHNNPERYIEMRDKGQELRAQQDLADERDAPLNETGAGLAGNVAGTIATFALPGGLATKAPATAGAARAFLNPQTFRAAAATGATYGATQPLGTDDSRLANTLLGAGTGVAAQGAFALGGRVAEPVKNVLSDAGKKAVQVLESAGVPLDAAQRTGSKALQRIKSSFKDNYFTQAADREFAEQQQGAFTRAVLKTIGEDADAATSDVMGRASQRIGQVFDDIAERNPIKYDNQLESGLASILKEARKELDDQQYGVIQRQVDNVLDKAAANNGAIPGKAYQNIKSSLDRLSLGGDQAKGEWARRLRETLDDSLGRSVGDADKAALKDARTQYRRLKQIEGALDKDGAGVISPARLANTIGVKKNAAQAFRGKGDQELVELAQAGKQILPDKLPNSGTTARALMQVLPTAALGAGAGAASGDPSNVAIGLLGGAFAPKVAQQLLRTNYLAGGLGGAPRNLLTAPNQNELIGMLLRQAPIAGALQAAE